jgi:TorA maturation chaperone TorD
MTDVDDAGDADDPPLSEEDKARADCYALVSRLFYAPADAELLQQLSATRKLEVQDPGDLQIVGWEIESDETPYTQALKTLRDASSNADAESLRQEYDDLFTGAGKALVTPYTSGYAVPHAPDRFLLALREHLVAWGLARHDTVFEIEDHVSAVCDVMRWLIERERPLEEQLAFFNDFVYTGVGTFCDAIDARATTPFYKAVAGVARTFLAIEKEAFELHAAQ